MIWNEILVFGGFILLILFMLFLDIGLFNKENKPVSFSNAVLWTSIWISLAIVFWGVIYFFGDKIHNPKSIGDIQNLIFHYGHPININGLNFSEALEVYRRNLGFEFITGYLIEYSLSIDNIFVILMIFYSFNIEKKFYHKVLFWGILGAIIMRFLFIFISAALIAQFSWLQYGFGGLLVITGIKMYLDRNKKEQIDTINHPVIRIVGKLFSVNNQDNTDKFFTRNAGKWSVNTIFVVLLVVEFSDVVFAVDSIPAIFSITLDPYMVYFSNVFAIIGLRSLFFLVENIIQRFWFLKTGLSALLVFIGGKMLVHEWYSISTIQSLIVVLVILIASIFISFAFPKKGTGK